MVSSKEDERSLFVSGIVKNKDKYLFLVKNPEQWQQDENGRLRLPFGTVESRVAKGETAESALMREFKKEIGAEVKIVNSETSHFIYNGQVDEMNMNARNNKPLFVYKEEKIEEDRRRFDYIYSFLTDAGKFDEIRPGFAQKSGQGQTVGRRTEAARRPHHFGNRTSRGCPALSDAVVKRALSVRQMPLTNSKKKVVFPFI